VILVLKLCLMMSGVARNRIAVRESIAGGSQHITGAPLVDRARRVTVPYGVNPQERIEECLLAKICIACRQVGLRELLARWERNMD
jgi:hypothetical protein